MTPLTEVADGFLRDAGHDVKIVRAGQQLRREGRSAELPVADAVIWRCRAAGGWRAVDRKNNMDDVFTGRSRFTVCQRDGRTRPDASKNTVPAALIQGKNICFPGRNAPLGSLHR